MSFIGDSSTVQLEIAAHKLQDLMARGVLYAEDLRCLNSSSRESVKALCLKACSQRIARLPQY